MTSTRKSIAFSTVANFSSQAFSLLLLVVTSRWLFPAEIGAFAMAFAVIMLVEPLREFQLSTFVIKAKEIDRTLMRAVQFVGITVGAICLVGALLAAWVMRESFESPLAGELLALLSLSFVIRPISQPAVAVLSREMKFGFLARLRIFAAALKVALTIGLLMFGLRAEAMAIGYLAEVACDLAAIAKVDRTFRFPWPSPRNSREVWAFSARVSGAQALNRGASSIGDLMVGSFLGLAAAGYYSRGSSLVRAFRSGVEGAVLPIAIAVFSKAVRSSEQTPKHAYLAGITFLTGFGWPVLGVLAVAAHPLIVVAYGGRWLAVPPVVQVLALGGIIYLASTLTQTVLASIGAVKALVQREVFIQLPRLVLLFIGVQFGIVACAWAMTASMAVALLVNQHLVARELKTDWTDLLRALRPSAGVLLGTCLPTFAVKELASTLTESQIAILLATLSAAGVFWLSSIFAVRHPFSEEVRRLTARAKGQMGR